MQKILEDMNNIMISTIDTNLLFIELVVGCFVLGALISLLMRKYGHGKPFFVHTIFASIFAIILSLNVLIGGNSLHFEIAPQNSFSINEFLVDGVSAFFVLLIGIVSLSVSNLKIRITKDMDEIL